MSRRAKRAAIYTPRSSSSDEAARRVGVTAVGSLGTNPRRVGVTARVYVRGSQSRKERRAGTSRERGICCQIVDVRTSTVVLGTSATPKSQTTTKFHAWFEATCHIRTAPAGRSPSTTEWSRNPGQFSPLFEQLCQAEFGQIPL